MTTRITRAAIAVLAGIAATSANALSISALPATQDVLAADGTATIDIVMNFEEQSIGGGFTIDLSGPIAFVSFAPSAYFNSLNTTNDDTDFTGFGTANKPADTDFEIHLGNFGGLGGNQVLGTLTVALTDIGTGVIDLAISPDIFYGGFFSLSAEEQAVTLNDATINSAVPLPTTAWLFATGMGLVGFWRRRR